MMRRSICFINPTYKFRRPLVEIASRLAQSYEVSIVYPVLKGTSPKQLWHSEISNDISLIPYEAVNIPGVNFEWPVPASFNFFKAIEKSMKADTIHTWAYFYLATPYIWLRSLFSKSKLILSADTFPGFSFNMGGITKIMRWYTLIFQFFLFRIPFRIHIYAESFKKFALRAGVSENKIVVIPTGVDTIKFEPSNKERSGILFVGMLTERKGILELIEVARQLPEEKFILVGDGQLRDLAEKEININCIGWRRDIPEWMQSSKALILPSKAEGIAGVILEALASGLIPVVSNIPGNQDMIHHGENGFLCSSIEDYVASIKSIHKIDRTRVRQSVEKLDWDFLIDSYSKLYMNEGK